MDNRSVTCPDCGGWMEIDSDADTMQCDTCNRRVEQGIVVDCDYNDKDAE